ncbi:MAG TPA: von Willebrand factor type A domain-containing protein, partial [Kofleriaceae bacterium]
MRLVRSSLLFVLLAACGSHKGSMYRHHPSAPPPADSIAAAGSVDGNTSVHHGVNPWIETAKDNLSTFAADVDTASYTLSRRSLNEGVLPPAASVRVEEYVNYFSYAFPKP